MTDDSTAVVSQPSAAEEQGQAGVASDYSSFLGPPSPETDLSQETPAPGAEQAEGEPELSGEQEGEPEQEAQPETAEGEAEESEQPPSIEERLKELTGRESDEYARRYPSAWKALQNPNTPEDLKHLLLDKIDSDHEIQRRIAQERQFEEQEEEPTLEYEPEQPQAQQPPVATAQDVAQQRTAYYNQIDNLVRTQYDQQAIQEMGQSLLRMFNVNMKMLEDPNTTPEDKAILSGLAQSAQREAPVLARLMTDAVATTVPHILRPALEAAVPGFLEFHERQMLGSAYESVRQQTDERGRALYPDLPAFPAVRGTPEAQAFSEKFRQAAEEIPGFYEMVFRDQQGRVLPEQQQAQLKYTILARHVSGQRANPALVAQAVETGRRLATQADQRRQTARVGGAGQRTAGPPGRATASDEDPLMAALDAEIARQEGNYQQPIRGRASGR